MHKKELVMILVLGVLFSLSGVFAGHFVEINGTVYYRVANTSTLSSYENNGNVTNGTIDLTNNIGGVLSDSLLQNVSPIVYLFPIADVSTTTATFIYNVSDDSNVSCSLHVSDRSPTEYEEVSTGVNNSFTHSNLAYSTTYNVSIYCVDVWGNGNFSNNVTFSVGAEPVVETPSSGGGGGILYNVDSGVNNGRFTKNIDVSVKINGTMHKLKVLNLTNQSVFFVLRSEPQNVSLNLNESKIVKVDSVNVKITLTKILGNVAYMNISKVVENMNEGESEVVIETPEVVDDEESELCFGEGIKEFCINYKTWGAILLIVVLVVIVVGLATKHHKVKKKRKSLV